MHKNYTFLIIIEIFIYFSDDKQIKYLSYGTRQSYQY